MQITEASRTLVRDVCCAHAIVEVQAMIPSRPSGNGRSTDRRITVVLDLCLYRVVSDRCRGQVLPYGVRQMIKDYAWVSFNNESLRAAVQLWCSNRTIALDRYGDINDWDVRKVTDMTRLFQHTVFNDQIDRWDVSNVTSMEEMFNNADEFAQPLASWDVSNVVSAKRMFCEAIDFNQPLDAWDTRHMT
jgi:hypothetical protein